MPSSSDRSGGGAVDPAVLALLRCPRCGGELQAVPNGLRCAHDATLFPVVDGIPLLTPEDARPER